MRLGIQLPNECDVLGRWCLLMPSILYLLLALRLGDKEEAHLLSSYLLKTVTILLHHFGVIKRERKLSEGGCEPLHVSHIDWGDGNR